jgi:hypothetical protein
MGNLSIRILLANKMYLKKDFDCVFSYSTNGCFSGTKRPILLSAVFLFHESVKTQELSADSEDYF